MITRFGYFVSFFGSTELAILWPFLCINWCPLNPNGLLKIFIKSTLRPGVHFRFFSCFDKTL
jgi:hypothetical protein